MSISDEDVLKATLTTLKILENSHENTNKRNLSVNQNNGKPDHDSSESSNMISSALNSEFSESVFMSSQSFGHEKCSTFINPNIHMKFQTVLESLEVINLMYKCYHENESLQKQNETSIQYLKDSYANVMSPSCVKERLKKIMNILDHITIISREGAKLRQVLRSNVLNDFWKINTNYHRCVIRFFHLAQEITNDINELILSLEKNKEHNSERSKNLHVLEAKLLAELHENLDILSEFRNYVHTSLSSS